MGDGQKLEIVSVNKCCVAFCFGRYGLDYACCLYAVCDYVSKKFANIRSQCSKILLQGTDSSRRFVISNHIHYAGSVEI